MGLLKKLQAKLPKKKFTQTEFIFMKDIPDTYPPEPNKAVKEYEDSRAKR